MPMYIGDHLGRQHVKRYLVIFAIPLTLTACGDSGEDCDIPGQQLLSRIRALEAENSACTSNEDCVAVGIFRSDCNGGPDLSVAINPSAAEEAERLIARAEACGYVPETVDDFDMRTALCMGGLCQLELYGQCLAQDPCPRPQEEVLEEIYDFALGHNDCESDADCVAVGVFRSHCDVAPELVVAVNPEAADVAERMIGDARVCGHIPLGPADVYYRQEAHCDSGSGSCQPKRFLRCGLPPLDAGPDASTADAAIDANTADAMEGTP